MASVPFHYVDLRTFCYATEDEDRVAAALRTFLPEDADVDRAPSEGHFGDPIVILSTRLDTTSDIQRVLDVVESLPADDFDSVVAELDERVDEDCTLHLTFDKQAAFGGTVCLGEGIILQAKIEAYPADRTAAVENARGILEAD